MLFEDKTQNNIMTDLKAAIEPGTNTEEGTLVDHAFRGAAAEFEQAYIELGMIEQNGYAETADREHLILRAKERGISPLPPSYAIWKAEFNIDIELNQRFSARELTYKCIEKLSPQIYKLACEQSGTKGNSMQNDLLPIEYIEGFEHGELIELLVPARNEEETETFRARYFAALTEVQAVGGNRAQYRQIMHEIEGVGACKIYRATQKEKQIKIFFLNSLYQVPSGELVKDVQEIIDPLGKQGEGEGKAAIFHVVDICPCQADTINIEVNITVDTGYAIEDMALLLEEQIDKYFLELAKVWENEEYLIVRILKINTAIASVEGIVDVKDTKLNGNAENILLESNSVPIRGEFICRQQ